MEIKYKVGLIGALIFTALAIVFYLLFKKSLLESEIYAFSISLVIAILLYKKLEEGR